MMIRTILAAAVGVSLLAGTVADASAKVVAQTGTKTVATQTIAGKPLRKVAAKHRVHFSHRAMTKRLKIAKFAGGKRLVVSHVVKRTTPKHV